MDTKFWKAKGVLTRVIVLTGVGTLEDGVKLLKSGVCDFMWKPADLDKIRNAVNRALTLDNAYNLYLSNITPMLDRLEESAKEQKHIMQAVLNTIVLNTSIALRKKNTELKEKLDVVLKKKVWENVFQKIAFLFSASLITAILYFIGIFDNSQLTFLLPVVLVFLLLFPVEKISSLYAKYKKVEAKIEISSPEKNEELSPLPSKFLKKL